MWLMTDNDIAINLKLCSEILIPDNNKCCVEFITSNDDFTACRRITFNFPTQADDYFNRIMGELNPIPAPTKDDGVRFDE